MWQRKAVLILGMVGAVTVLGFSKGGTVWGEQARGPRLVSIEPLSDAVGPLCEWVPASRAGSRLAASAQQGQVSTASAGAVPDAAARLAASQREPVRMIRDPRPVYSSVAVDPTRNEVVFTDENNHGLLVYDRLANTPPTAAFSEPKRAIGGSKTKIGFECGVYIDPTSGDIYAVDNDVINMVAIFSRQAIGNVDPTREVYTPHGTFGIAVDEGAQQMYLTVQHDNAVVVYPKMAQKDDPPVRLLQGNRTGLGDPHGIALDPKNRLMFVLNHGSFHEKAPGGRLATKGGGRALNKPNWPVGDGVPGSGKHLPPSITIHALDAKGDTPPLRTIAGPDTQLNWPMGIAFDPKRNELFVANDTGDAVLVFSATANGNVAPARILKGPKSLVKNPTGVFVDTQNDELWVTNFSSHAATVYSPSAGGDTPPLRVIRSAPLGSPAPNIGNPGAVAYDSKRDEILVPN